MIKLRNIDPSTRSIISAGGETLLFNESFGTGVSGDGSIWLAGVDKLEIMSVSVMHNGYAGGDPDWECQQRVTQYAELESPFSYGVSAVAHVLVDFYDPRLQEHFSFEKRNADGTPLLTLYPWPTVEPVVETGYTSGIGIFYTFQMHNSPLPDTGNGRAMIFARIHRTEI